MCCTRKIKTVTAARRVVVYSTGNGSATGALHVLSPERLTGIAPLLKAVRVSVEIENATPDLLTQAVFQSSDDGVNWAAPVPLENEGMPGDRTTTTPWHAAENSFQRGIRFGLLVSGRTPATQMAKASMLVDLELR